MDVRAGLEFVEPGSSIPFEIKLEAFAKMCNETKRANFYITRNVKTGKWRIHFGGIRKVFKGDKLPSILEEAAQFVFNNRKDVEGIKRLEA